MAILKYPGTRIHYPGTSSSKKMIKKPGTRVIDTRYWTHYLQYTILIQLKMIQLIFLMISFKIIT
jgi:hypothetical protein